MDADLSPETRERVVEHVLREVHPDRREATVVGVALDGGQRRVGVKAHPSGYLSAAKYALVAVDATGAVTGSEACTGGELRRALGGE